MNKTKCQIITIIGEPNAGKSTLVNRLVGSKISIVSNKVQTTRNAIKGITVIGNTQLIFIDTPGIFNAKHNLEKAINHEALSQLDSGDTALIMIDSSRDNFTKTEEIASSLKESKQRVALVINKIDLLKNKNKLLQLAERFHKSGVFDEIFMISSRDGEGVKDLENYLVETATPSEFLYPEDQMSDMPVRFMASELTREKLFENVHDELPYNLFVETEGWVETDDKIVINQVINVMKEGQKAIVIGKGAEMIKKIGTEVRLELQDMFEKKINLFLHAKVKKDWLDKPFVFQSLGLKFPKK
ncbi:MAG: GTPase Era [Rickettsiales bacterium]|nr:GTPase Era [Rickettsiales bacterium]